MKKYWKTICALVAATVVSTVYFCPLSLDKLINQDDELSINLNEYRIVNGEPQINNRDYGKINYSSKDKIVNLLKDYRYYRTPGTIFSDGTIGHINGSLITIYVFCNGTADRIICISSGRIAVNNKTYYFPNSKEFVERISTLLGE